MPALVAGIHVLLHCGKKDVDGRNKSGHDDDLRSFLAASYVFKAHLRTPPQPPLRPISDVTKHDRHRDPEF
jgi:hypothetical protein